MSARPGLCGGYHAEWYPYRDRELHGLGKGKLAPEDAIDLPCRMRS
jgi:hypothetical protein